MNTIGQTIRATFFGESHGSALGIVLDGLPAGIVLDETRIQNALTLRRPKSMYSTSRSEPDNYEILSGLYEGKTTGAALTFLIRNQNTISADYSALVGRPRPSHADYPAHVKYEGFNDPRGGGIFSGRLTALWVIAGAIAMQLLEEQGIFVGSHIRRLANIEDDGFDFVHVQGTTLQRLSQSEFPLLNPRVEPLMKAAILEAKEEMDSVGGVVETAVTGLQPGLGSPLFDSIESRIASLLFDVPSIKGIEFGTGFPITQMRGSSANDPYQLVEGKIQTKTNHNGGILGGMTTGMPLVFRVAVKPTPSIGKPQTTVNLQTMKEETLEIKGRHDPAIVNRVVHVINAVTAFGILDLILSSPKAR
ncbi:MAG: chorismate synthase [Candidatus Izemoplasmatales bacterium]|nr:chorismate synthase [Candidatus Izemoplasmatales bacterium]